MARKLSFHIEPAASPAKIPLLLQLLVETNRPISKGTDLDELARQHSSDLNQFYNARSLAEQHLGLIGVSKTGLEATASAKVILQKREAVQYDLLHFLFYTAWQASQPAQHTQAWFYRAVCEVLWTLQEAELNLTTRTSLTQQLTNQALDKFEGVVGFEAQKFSLGLKSMAGALEWLRQLQPSVLADSRFSRRVACSPELFLLALGYSHQTGEVEVGIDLLLTQARQYSVAQLCLLDPLYFDQMLDWVLPAFPQFITSGTTTGSYGRFIRLHRRVTIEDLA